MKKIMSVMLCMIILLTSFISSEVIAANINTGNIVGSEAKILTEQISDEVNSYAIENYKNYIRIAIRYKEDTGLTDSNMVNYSLGRGIKLYNPGKPGRFFYPVVYLNDIVAIISVTEIDGELYSSFSLGFAEELNMFFKHQKGNYILTTVSGKMVATNGDNAILLEKGSTVDLDLVNEIISNIDMTNLMDLEEVSCSDRLYCSPEYEIMSDPDAPLEYISLPVPIKKQPRGSKLCWAACVGMIIQYKTGTYLTAFQVAQSVGLGLQDSGSPAAIIEAARLEGVTLVQMHGILSIANIKINLNRGNPILMNFECPDPVPWGQAHAFVMKGYERYSTGSYCVALDPQLDSDDINIFPINSSGGVSFTLDHGNGDVQLWTWVDSYV